MQMTDQEALAWVIVSIIGTLVGIAVLAAALRIPLWAAVILMLLIIAAGAMKKQ
jgi:hypothetical protein